MRQIINQPVLLPRQLSLLDDCKIVVNHGGRLLASATIGAPIVAYAFAASFSSRIRL